MTTPKPVYSRPSDDAPAPAPKRKRRRKRKNAAPTAVNKSFTPHEDDGVAFHDPITGTHHTRNQRTHRREKRRDRELRAENEKLHRRLAAIYDALSLD